MSAYAATTAFLGALVGHGMTDVVVSPGLRSAPLALAAHAVPGLRLMVQHDERVAGFVALGMARATDRPVGVICTSGSAVANLLPAVVEAHHSRLPLIVLTGDRPPELHGWESPQTIDQEHIFGGFCGYVGMPSADEVTPGSAIEAGRDVWDLVTGRPPGPVHVNWPFREPLEPGGPIDVAPIEPMSAAAADPAAISDRDAETIAAVTAREQGIIAVGELHPAERSAVLDIAATTGWPIIADPLSGLRRPQRPEHVVAFADHLVGHRDWADAHAPEVVLRLGSPPTSKSLRLWMERRRPERVVVVDPAGRRRDPSRTMTDLVQAAPTDVAAVVGHAEVARPVTGWLESWVEADRLARHVIAGVIASSPFSEAAATVATGDALAPGARWHVASSTPIRDVDWYVSSTAAELSANRGASGIDGTVSTALGTASGSGEPTVVTIGDVALTHDLGGLMAAGNSEAPPVVVLYDNGGGGIFSLLPIATAADPVAFREVLHTPTSLDVPALAAATRYRYIQAGDADTLADSLARARRGAIPQLIHVPLSIDESARQLAAVRRGFAEST